MLSFKSLAVRRLQGILTAAALSAAASAAPIVTPTGLNVGDQYRLAFVTSTARSATAQFIEDYNNFVTNAANTQTALSALGTTWTAIASEYFRGIAARDNTGTNPGVSAGVPIFLLDGTTKVADSNADLWDGSIDAAINRDESGAIVVDGTKIWTGTSSAGTPDNGLAEPTFSIVTGRVGVLGPGWIDFAQDTFPPDALQFYALSGILTVEAASPAPEPAPLALMVIALAGLGWARRRPRRKA